MISSKKHVPQLRFTEFEGDWKHERLNELLSESKKRNTKLQFGKEDVLSVSGELGIVNQIEHLGRSYAGQSVHNYHIVEAGDIVYTKSPLKAAPYGIIKSNKGKAGIVSTLYAVYKVNEKTAYGLFLDYYFSLSSNLNRYLRPLVKKGAKNDMKINNAYVLNDKIFIPSTLSEQEKISSFLKAIDKKIDILSQKKTLLEKYKSGVMQQIFSQKIRFKDNNNNDYPEWEEMELKDFLKQTVREIKKPNEPFLAIGVKSHCKGTFQKPNFDPESIAMESLFKVMKNDLIVNITFAWEGAIALVKQEDQDGLVSHRFPTYVFNEEIVTHRFFKYIFSQKKFVSTLELISPGGAGRNRVLNKNKFLKIKWYLPTIKEQSKIANFLEGIDDKIDILKNQLDTTKQFKIGLLQQLFV